MNSDNVSSVFLRLLFYCPVVNCLQHCYSAIVHSTLDYCNSLYYKLPKSQLSCLQQIHNTLARTVVKAPKSYHITPTIRSLYWVRITERNEYKLLISLTYKVLTTTQSPYPHNPISVQRPRCARSPFVVSLALPKATDIILSKNN